MQALLHSSHLYHEATHNMASHGISVGEVSMDVGKMMESKTTKVDQLTGGIEYLCKKYKVTSIFVQYFDTVRQRRTGVTASVGKVSTWFYTW